MFYMLCELLFFLLFVVFPLFLLAIYLQMNNIYGLFLKELRVSTYIFGSYAVGPDFRHSQSMETIFSLCTYTIVYIILWFYFGFMRPAYQASIMNYKPSMDGNQKWFCWMNNPNLPTIMGSQIRLSNDMFLMAAESVNERTIRI